MQLRIGPIFSKSGRALLDLTHPTATNSSGNNFGLDRPFPLPPTATRRGTGPGTYAIGSVVALVIVYWTVSLGEWIHDQFRRDATLGYLILPFVIAAFFFFARWIWSEIGGWRRLLVADGLRSDLSDTHHGQLDKERFLSALRHLERTMDGSQRAAIATFLKSADVGRSTDDLRNALEHDVIHPMDDEALNVVLRSARDLFMISLLIPRPVVETALFVTRATWMIRCVSIAYGHRPSKLGQYRLIKRILGDVAILTGVMTLLSRAPNAAGDMLRKGTKFVGTALTFSHHPAVEAVGIGVRGLGEVAGAVADMAAEPLAEAFTAATRVAQLGVIAIAVSRPIRLTAHRRAQLVSQLWDGLVHLHKTAQQTRESQVHAEIGVPREGETASPII